MRSRGFTLVELVVVIAIMTLLIGLSMPVVRQSRERAHAVVCAGRIRQLLAGLLSYDVQNGTFPWGFRAPSKGLEFPDNHPGIPGAVDLPGRWWFDYLEKFDHATGDREEMLTCPSKRQDDFLLSLDLLCGNYGANLSIFRTEQYIPPYRTSFSGKPLSSCRIRRSADTLLLVDSGYSLICWWHVTSRPPVPLPPPSLISGGVQHAAYVPGMSINADKMLLSGQTPDAKGERHPNKTVNVGFADGSVALKKADDLLVEKSEDCWDNDPLWQPCGDTISSQVTAP
jgi:prepilin-type N-terminal cleavage/methylation domain-containing protein/prepilin-type processing-associated H-X9-DG protein